VVRDTSGEGRGKPDFKGAVLQGQVVSRTYSHHRASGADTAGHFRSEQGFASLRPDIGGQSADVAEQDFSPRARRTGESGAPSSVWGNAAARYASALAPRAASRAAASPSLDTRCRLARTRSVAAHQVRRRAETPPPARPRRPPRPRRSSPPGPTAPPPAPRATHSRPAIESTAHAGRPTGRPRPPPPEPDCAVQLRRKRAERQRRLLRFDPREPPTGVSANALSSREAPAQD